MQDTDEIARETGTRRLSGRIHILGVGNVGTFVAHALASRQSPPPMTLLLHNTSLYQTWATKKECLAIQRNGLDDVKTGFDVNVQSGNNIWYSIPYGGRGIGQQGHEDVGDVEVDVPARVKRRIADHEMQELLGQSEEDDSIIECLIVSVKAPQTVKALKSVSHRLTQHSTICLIQNGMGTIEELNAKVFLNPASRPHYMLGVFSHGLLQQTPFQIAHTGVGTTIVSPITPPGTPAIDNEADWAPTTKYLLRTLTLTPSLVAVAENPSSIILYQLEKLALNAVINPLTALIECKNGELLYNYRFTRIFRLLLFEISSVICALPEVQGIPGIEARFAPERLRWLVVQLAHKTEKNISSMLNDMITQRHTEVGYINGYFVRRGEELGIKCVVNYMIEMMVKSKQELLLNREAGAVPFDLTKLEIDD